jgi:hypothetical protein
MNCVLMLRDLSWDDKKQFKMRYVFKLDLRSYSHENGYMRKVTAIARSSSLRNTNQKVTLDILSMQYCFSNELLTQERHFICSS